MTWNDAGYPPNLRQIHDPPPFLFVLGALQPRDRMAVAVVGSRNVSAYGLRMTRELTEGLVRYGITVVSGLARGTDAAGALERRCAPAAARSPCWAPGLTSSTRVSIMRSSTRSPSKEPW